MLYSNETRIIRARLDALGPAADRARAGGPAFRSAAQLVKVFQETTIPTAADKFYACHPCEADGTESEGSTPTFTCDDGATLYVDFIRGAPAAGEMHVADAIGGRWVAQKKGNQNHICLVGCGGAPVVGYTIDVYTDITKSTHEFSCVTPATGCCTVPLSGSHYVVVTSDQGTIVNQAQRTIAGTLTIALSSTDFVCCGSLLIPKHLTLTDGAATIDFWYDPSSFFPTWFGGHAVTRTSCPATAPNNVCMVGEPSYGPVHICYQMICFSNQDPKFSIQRSWSWVVEQVTLTPIWYQDDTGITPGVPCVTSPPAACGSPLTDTASFSANPSSTAPFALSGTPVPDTANSTSEPLSGSIAISA